MNYVKVATCIVLLISTSINAIAQSNHEDNTFYTKFIFYLSLFLSLIFSILLYKLKNKDLKRSSLELAIWLSGWFAIFGFFISFIVQFGKVQNLLWYPHAWSSTVFTGILIPTLVLAGIGFVLGFLLRIHSFNRIKK